METFSALLAICAANSSVTGEFLAQRPVTRSFDVFFDLGLNERLSKQSWGWWFEMPSPPLWRHSNVTRQFALFIILVQDFSNTRQVYIISDKYNHSFFTSRQSGASSNSKHITPTICVSLCLLTHHYNSVIIISQEHTASPIKPLNSHDGEGHRNRWITESEFNDQEIDDQHDCNVH